MKKKFLEMALNALINLIVNMTPEQRVDILDTILDEVEKRNIEHTSVMSICSIIRSILGVPDDDVDQEKPV